HLVHLHARAVILRGEIDLEGNAVLTQLAKAGLIERRKKSGSFVTQPQAQSAVLEIHDIKAEVQSLNLPYSYAVSKKTS
ncbi:hypothetical protein ACC792_37950, partial [Rhizobium ruizarguesonis]